MRCCRGALPTRTELSLAHDGGDIIVMLFMIFKIWLGASTQQISHQSVQNIRVASKSRQTLQAVLIHWIQPVDSATGIRVFCLL